MSSILNLFIAFVISIVVLFPKDCFYSLNILLVFFLNSTVFLLIGYNMLLFSNDSF